MVLFGSCVRGEITRDSDVDLMVVMPDGTDPREAAGEMLNTLADAGAAKDVLVVTPQILRKFRNTPGLIYRTVIREGRTLYGRLP